MLELFPPCFSCSKNFIRSQSSSGFSGEKTVEILEAVIAGDLSNFIRVLCLGFFYLELFDQNAFPLHINTFFY